MITLRIIWGAMLFSLLIYLSMGVLLGRTLPFFLAGTETMNILRGVLYGAAVIELFIAWFLRRRMLGAGEGDMTVRAALGKYATAVTVFLVLSESVAIYGLVLFMLGGDKTDLYFLVALAAAAMIFYRPRTDEVLAMTGGGRKSRGEYRQGRRERH